MWCDNSIIVTTLTPIYVRQSTQQIFFSLIQHRYKSPKDEVFFFLNNKGIWQKICGPLSRKQFDLAYVQTTNDFRIRDMAIPLFCSILFCFFCVLFMWSGASESLYLVIFFHSHSHPIIARYISIILIITRTFFGPYFTSLLITYLTYRYVECSDAAKASGLSNRKPGQLLTRYVYVYVYVYVQV